MGAVQCQHIGTGLQQATGTLYYVCGNANGCAAEQPTRLVTGGVGILVGLFDILNGDEALEVEVRIHNGKLLDLVLPQDLLCFLQRNALRSSHQILMGHDLGDGTAEIRFKLHIPVGDDANQLPILHTDGNTRDLVLAHQVVRILKGIVGSQIEGVGDNAVFRALFHVHLLDLLFNGHVLVDDTDTALSGHGNGHLILGNGVHSRRKQRDVQVDFLCELGAQRDLTGHYFAGCGDQQHIVKGQPLFVELLRRIVIYHHANLSFVFPLVWNISVYSTHFVPLRQHHISDIGLKL